MKAVLVAINAKYIHTNPAVRSIAGYVEGMGLPRPDICEYTINHKVRTILEGAFSTMGDIYFFSCYIWNVEIALLVAAQLKRLRQDALIIFGGPQAGSDGKAFLRQNPDVDLVVAGEGEATVCRLFSRMIQGRGCEDLHGIVYRDKSGEIIATEIRPPLSMDKLPFVYSDLYSLEGRIPYYESMRGCPFSCSYCMSGSADTVRLRSLNLVYYDLSRFLEAGVPQVKLVDRTFNCDTGRALAIWKYLRDQDNGVTNFHFELAGELLNGETVNFLSTVRPGQFQFEIGVQSTNEKTLREIKRPAGLDRLFHSVKKLKKTGNIHLHLDLIAGLPYEDFNRFSQSFDQVYQLQPHQLQLGFLKVLPGSQMEKKAWEYRLCYSPKAPFEILRNHWISFNSLTELHGIEKMVDIYYNSRRFSYIVGHLCEMFPRPFDFYQRLWHFFWEKHGDRPVEKTAYYQVLWEFACRQGIALGDRAKWLCKFDLLCHEKPRKLPTWVDVDLSRDYQTQIREFYADRENIERYLPEYQGQDPRHISRVTHLEVFPFNPEQSDEKITTILFNYKIRDIDGKAQRHIVDVKH